MKQGIYCETPQAPQLVKKFPAFHEVRNAITVVKRARNFPFLEPYKPVPYSFILPL